MAASKGTRVATAGLLSNIPKACFLLASLCVSCNFSLRFIPFKVDIVKLWNGPMINFNMRSLIYTDRQGPKL